jgi:hypothetical protein
MNFEPKDLRPIRVPRVDKELRDVSIERYKTLKKAGVRAQMGAVRLTKDVLASKLKAFGSKFLFGLIAEPVL